MTVPKYKRLTDLLRKIKKWVYNEPVIRINMAQLRLREKLFVKSYENFNFFEIPIIINNFNRLEYPRMMIEALENMGYTNIYIIDNKSDYPPLLEYYDRCNHHVFRLDKNIGHDSFWKSGIYKKFRNQWFVYSDADIVPGKNCPADFVKRLYLIAQKYHSIKTGLALHIDDLPDCYEHKQKVVVWEQHFWENPLEMDVYKAEIDTTFALYRPNIMRTRYNRGIDIRVGGDMTAHHMPWYVDSANPSPEEQNYIDTCRPVASWSYSRSPKSRSCYTNYMKSKTSEMKKN